MKIPVFAGIIRHFRRKEPQLMLHVFRKSVFLPIFTLTVLLMLSACSQNITNDKGSLPSSGNQTSRTDSEPSQDQSLPDSADSGTERETDTTHETGTLPEPDNTQASETAGTPSDTDSPETNPETEPETEPRSDQTAKGFPITVKDGITYVGGILIANKTYTLPETYAPGKIIPECYQSFLEMAAAAAKDGIKLFIRSDYRSYYDQRYIYAGYVRKDGVEAADRYSARAGHSEHQSGLALDLNSFEYSLGETPEGKWLAANAHLYGFIIRYPADKEAQTGYRYEPWHVRYLGKDIAADVYNSGLCLEEYLGITSSYDNCPLCNAEVQDEG